MLGGRQISKRIFALIWRNIHCKRREGERRTSVLRRYRFRHSEFLLFFFSVERNSVTYSVCLEKTERSAIYIVDSCSVWTVATVLWTIPTTHQIGSSTGNCPHPMTRIRFIKKWTDPHPRPAHPHPIKTNQVRLGQNTPAPRPGPRPVLLLWLRHRTGANGNGPTRSCGHGFPPNACENSKYPKGTPFIPIFSYLNPSTFHTISNVGLKYLSFFNPL